MYCFSFKKISLFIANNRTIIKFKYNLSFADSNSTKRHSFNNYRMLCCFNITDLFNPSNMLSKQLIYKMTKYSYFYKIKSRGICKDLLCSCCGKEDDPRCCECCIALSDACNCRTPTVDQCLDSCCPKRVKFYLKM